MMTMKLFSALYYYLFCFLLLWNDATSTSYDDDIVVLENLEKGDSYLARRANFGGYIDYGEVLNVMLPPEGDPFLCKYPEDLINVNTYDGNSGRDHVLAEPIAFLARETSNCSVVQQARVAARIQKKFPLSKVEYLIIYGSDKEDDFLKELNPTMEPPSSVSRISILYVTHRTGKKILFQMREFESTRGTSANFLSDGNDEWSLFFSITPRFNTGGHYGDSGDGSRQRDHNRDDFYWFRIILFTLLIISPCLRAMYLWWSGGGRFRFRRNERGRIVGIRYIPPMPYWLTSGLRPRQAEAPSTRIPEDKFNELPEIVYQPPEEDDGELREEEEINVDTDTTTPDNTTNVVSNDVPSSHSVEEENDVANRGSIEPPNETFSQQEDGVEDASLEECTSMEPETRTSMTTTCTMCSICIDDFQAGERLILLPRCQHAFHRDCLHPWLCERQGCCPLCKTNVFAEDDVVENETDRESFSEPVAGESSQESDEAEEEAEATRQNV